MARCDRRRCYSNVETSAVSDRRGRDVYGRICETCDNEERR
jgi:hypothetical protein